MRGLHKAANFTHCLPPASSLQPSRRHDVMQNKFGHNSTSKKARCTVGTQLAVLLLTSLGLNNYYNCTHGQSSQRQKTVMSFPSQMGHKCTYRQLKNWPSFKFFQSQKRTITHNTFSHHFAYFTYFNEGTPLAIIVRDCRDSGALC